MKLALFTILILSSVTNEVSARSIYGEDNRQEVIHSQNSLYKKIAKSMAAMIPNERLQSVENKFKIIGPKVKDDKNLCADERFVEQVSAATCTGTLIAPNILVTAAHCFMEGPEEACEKNSWVFDFKNETSDQTEFSVPKKSVYQCKNILRNNLDLEQGKDYVLVELDREVTDRKPVKVRAGGEITVGTPLVLIGFPNGVSMKVAGGGEVLNLGHNSFTTNLDAFVGNSGAGVFNANTGQLEGILSWGNEDYRYTDKQCNQSQVYTMEDGIETVMDVKDIHVFLKSAQKSSFLLKLFGKKSK